MLRSAASRLRRESSTLWRALPAWVGVGYNGACMALQDLSNVVPGAKWGLEMRGNEHKSKAPGRVVRPAGARSAMNEVVCGAMMLAYERAGKWDEVMLCLSCSYFRGCEESPAAFGHSAPMTWSRDASHFFTPLAACDHSTRMLLLFTVIAG